MGRYDLYQRKKPVGSFLFLATFLTISGLGAWLYFQPQKVVETDRARVTLDLILPKRQLGHDAENRGVPRLSLSSNGNLSESVNEKEQLALPRLNESDVFINELLSALSPELAARLKSDQLIRRITLIVNDFSQGQRVYKHMRWLKIDKPFRAEEDGQGFYLTSKSYRRYDALAEAVDSVNVQAALGLYKRVRPLCEEVFLGFGYPEHYRLEDLIKKAAIEILSAPVIEKRIALEKPAGLYRFADERLESLNPVQKQMLRMGPQNTRIIQNKLRLLIQAFVDDNGVTYNANE